MPAEVLGPALSEGEREAMPSAADQKRIVPCPRCGRAMPAGRDLCDVCSAELRGLVPPLADVQKRPGCVTAYAILLWIASGLIVWGSIALMQDRGVLVELGLLDVIPESSLRTTAWVLIGESVLNVAIGFGLWRLKNWARMLVVVLQSLALVYGVISICGLSRLMAEPGMGSSLFVAIVGVAINGFIAVWFAQHRRYFH